MKVEISSPKGLNGEWLYASLDLPAEEHEIRDAYHRARVMSHEDERYLSVYDCDAFPMLSFVRVETEGIDELNFLAQRLDSLEEHERNYYMKFSLTKALILMLTLTLALAAFASCDTGSAETESESGDGELKNFDYLSADLDEYITLPDYDYLKNTVTLGSEYVVTDEMIDEYMADFLFDKKTKTNGDTQVTDQPIKLGDSAFIYYTGYLNGVAFNGGSNASDAKPYELSIGSGSFIPGFEEGLIGIVPSSTSKDAPYDLHVTFPENYNQKDLAGKAVIFKARCCSC